MTRVKLLTSDFKLVTDRVDVHGYATGMPKVLHYGDRTFYHHEGNIYLECFAPQVIPWENKTEKLQFSGV